MNLPRNKLRVVVNVVEKLVLDGAIPTRILMLVRDLMAFRLKINVATKADNGKRESTNKNYMNVMFDNKGMDMINLSRILNSYKVMAAVPNYLSGPPPIVSYTYTRTIAGKIFNNRKVVNELIMDCGTAGMVCSCNSSRYKYESCGHVVKGDLSIIKDVKLRNLISKGPTYREQNNIDWRVNLKIIFHYEYLYMKNLMRDNLCMAKRFSNTVRYIDDLLTLKNSNFEEEIPNT